MNGNVNTKIRNMQAYDRGIWDWTIFRGCFGNTMITPTDIDGMVERNGNFLFIETKQPGAPLPMGQEIALRQLARDGCTVFVVWGDEREIVKMIRFSYMSLPDDLHYENPSVEMLRQEISRWWEFANANPNPLRMASILHKKYGPDFCDRLMAEFVRLSMNQ